MWSVIIYNSIFLVEEVFEKMKPAVVAWIAVCLVTTVVASLDVLTKEAIQSEWQLFKKQHCEYRKIYSRAGMG